MRKVVCIYLLLMSVSCSRKPMPEGILAPDKMEKVVYDLLKGDEYVNNFISKDTTVDIKMKRSIIYEEVFKLHNTNRKEFYTSYKYYQQHPDIQKALFDSLLSAANREKVKPPPILPLKATKAK